MTVTAIEWDGLCTERGKEYSMSDILLQNVDLFRNLVAHGDAREGK